MRRAAPPPSEGKARSGGLFAARAPGARFAAAGNLRLAPAVGKNAHRVNPEEDQQAKAQREKEKIKEAKAAAAKSPTERVRPVASTRSQSSPRPGRAG